MVLREWKQSETVPLMADAIEMSLRNNLFLFFDVKDTSAEVVHNHVPLLYEIIRYFEAFSHFSGIRSDCRTVPKTRTVIPEVRSVSV